MKIRNLFVVVLLIFVCVDVQAQNRRKSKQVVDVDLLMPGDTVKNLVIRDLLGNPASLPYWGEKNILIFYVDPDAYLNGNDTADFAAEIEENKRAAGPAIEGFGILDFPDTWLPKELLRKICHKRTERNGAIIIEDSQHLVKNQWRLGDCNGKFLLILVKKDGTVGYIRREPMDDAGKVEFYNMIKNYTHE